MDKMQKIACLAAYCALSPQKRMGGFDALAEVARQDNLLEALCEQLTILDVPVLLRRLARRQQKVKPLDWDKVSIQDEQVFWQDTPVGAIRTLYKPMLPTEWQARIAYDSFITRFLRYLQSTYKVAVLAEDEAHVRLFIPADQSLDLATAWETFVQKAFSTEALLQTFVLMLNSGKLSARGGFSTPRLPILTRDQALVMVAQLYASMAERRQGLARLERDLGQQQSELNQLQDVQPQGWEKKVETLQKKLADTNERLTTQRNNYGESIQAMAELEERMPETFKEVRRLARAYNATARRQLKVTAAVVRKYVKEAKRLVTLSPADYYTLPPLLLDSEPVMAYRMPGDYADDFCYVCGRAISDPANRFEANKLILSSPSQTLQTRTAQTQPWVCGTCAALAMASPVKLTGDNLIVLLREGDDGIYLYEDHLRMLVLGELNIVAGRYVSVRCTERIDNKLFIDTLGAEQYALYKVALTFPADALSRYRVEAILGEALLELPARHLVWLRGLIDVFNLNPSAVNQTRSRFAALGQAIRYVQKEELVYAIYTLASVFTAGQHYSAAQANQLEALRADHVRRLQMEEKPEASRFRDVAALTGMLVAFANYVRLEAPKFGKEAEREVEKLLEKVDNPNHFTYEAAGSLPGTGATLWRSADNYFIYDEAAKLLERLSVNRAERETVDGNQRRLQFYFDDIVKAYTLLFEEDYRTEKARREFTYELKLSLYSRFPEYLKPKSKEA